MSTPGANGKAIEVNINSAIHRTYIRKTYPLPVCSYKQRQLVKTKQKETYGNIGGHNTNFHLGPQSPTLAAAAAATSS